MFQPEINFSPEKGKIYDFFALLNHSTKTSDINTIYKELDVKLDDEIISSYTRIYTAIQLMNNDLLKLLFTSSDNGISFFSMFKNQLLEANNIEDIINKIVNNDNNYYPIRILNFLDVQHNLNDKFYKKLLIDREMLYDYIDCLNLSDRNKWTLIRFIDDPQQMLDDLYLAFITIKNELDIEYKILKEYRENYYSIIRKIICENQNDITAIKNIFPINRYEIRDINFEKINIFISMFLPYTVQGIWNNRTLHLYLGFYYDQQINKKTNDLKDIAFVFKAFSDETRNKIINLVKEKPYIGFGDLGNELEMPLSSLSHHIDIIIEAGIIKRINEGKKTFFSINNNGLENAMSILSLIKKQ